MKESLRYLYQAELRATRTAQCVVEFHLTCSSRQDVPPHHTHTYMFLYRQSHHSTGTHVCESKISKNSEVAILLELFQGFHRVLSWVLFFLPFMLMVSLWTWCPLAHSLYSVWAPHTVKDIQALEGVQKFACRIATHLWSAGYDDLLSLLGLSSLERRRLEQKFCYLFKFVHNLYFFSTWFGWYIHKWVWFVCMYTCMVCVVVCVFVVFVCGVYLCVWCVHGSVCVHLAVCMVCVCVCLHLCAHTHTHTHTHT